MTITPPITPRWEWRAFDTWLGPAEAAFAALTPSGVQESDELYLLTPAGDNVKVRDDLMDIKVLREIDEHGLERWAPVMKAAFPLSDQDVERVCQALRLEVPPRSGGVWPLERFAAEVVDPSTAVRAVSVHKRRARYAVAGCTAEVSEVSAAGRSTRTMAIESADAAAVVAAVRTMGLGGYRNVSYPRGLEALIDRRPARFAVIDLGTNSVKLHVGERDARGAWLTLVDRAEVTRLGEGLAETGSISPAAAARTLRAVEGMVEEARAHDVLAIALVATAGMRTADNAASLIESVAERTGVDVEVISGEEESRLAYLAVESALGPGHGALVVFDTGGGSSQFTFGHDGRIDERFSVDVGAARYTERFGLDHAVGLEDLELALDAIAADLARIDGRPFPRALVGMGGAITNLAAVRHALATYDPAVIQGSVLDRGEVDRQIESYRTRDAAARRSIVGLQPARAETILAGACIVRTVMEMLGQASLTVSDRGLRHGVLTERFGGVPAGRAAGAGPRNACRPAGTAVPGSLLAQSRK